MTELKEKKLQRLKFLMFLYERTGGKTVAYFAAWEDIGAKLKLDQDTSLDIAQYWRDEGCIEYATCGPTIRLTPGGIRTCEALLLDQAIQDSNTKGPIGFRPESAPHEQGAD